MVVQSDAKKWVLKVGLKGKSTGAEGVNKLHEKRFH